MTVTFERTVDADWSKALIELAKIGGGPLLMAFYALRAGNHKVWVWGWLLEEWIGRYRELEARYKALEDKHDKRVAEIEKELRDALRRELDRTDRGDRP